MGSITRISAALGALVATAALAQAGAPSGPNSPPPPERPGMAAPDGAGWAARREAMEARRQAMEARRAQREAERESDLALLLDLKPQQRERLHAFLAAMQPPHDGMGGKPGEHGPGQGGHDRGPGDDAHRDESFSSRLADMQAHLDQRTRDEQGRLATARSFYTSLDTRQQQKFDAIERLHRHMHEGPPPMGHGMAPPPPDGRPMGHDMAPPPPPPGE